MLNPGDRFGDYRVLGLLGKGGMGSVFLLENADERISTPVEVTTAISQIVHGHEVTIVRKRPSVVSKKSASCSGSVRKVVAILFGCVAVAGIAMLVYFGSRGGPSGISPSIVTKTNVVEKVVERIVEKKAESKTTALGPATPHQESGKSKDWRPGPNGRWFVNWDEALADARDRQRPILVLNTGSTWCHWCKKLRAEVLDHDVFREFTDAEGEELARFSGYGGGGSSAFMRRLEDSVMDAERKRKRRK